MRPKLPELYYIPVYKVRKIVEKSKILEQLKNIINLDWL